jgi:hypothetical protein
MTKRSSLAGIATTLQRVVDVEMVLERTRGGTHLRHPPCLHVQKSLTQGKLESEHGRPPMAQTGRTEKENQKKLFSSVVNSLETFSILGGKVHWYSVGGGLGGIIFSFP